MSEIPAQLEGREYFIRLEPQSKAPKVSPEGPFYDYDDPQLLNWINNGGNVGYTLNDDLVVFDIDSQEFRNALSEIGLPSTLAIRTGGGGEHRWYRCPGWSDCHQFKSGVGDLGSIRSDNWYAVLPPSIHDETGDRYRVSVRKPIAPIPPVALRDIVSELKPKDRQHSGGARRGCVGGSVAFNTDLEIPDDYPNRSADWTAAKRWLDQNSLLAKLDQSSSSDWSGDEFVLAKCLAEGGFSVETISDVLDRLSPNSKWHRRGNRYRNTTLSRAIEAAANDPYVSWGDPAYKPDSMGERRKMEIGGSNADLTGGETTMADFTELEEAPILEASEPGDSTKKVTLVEGTDDDGEKFHYVALKKGYLREGQTTEGETVVFDNTTDSVSLGSPEYIEDLIDGLDRLNEKLNGQIDN